MRKTALLISTVATSLVRQSPASWALLGERCFDLYFAAGRDESVDQLKERGAFIPLRTSRGVASFSHLALARRLAALAHHDWNLVQVQSPIASAVWRLVGRRFRGPSLYVAHGFHFHSDGGQPANTFAAAAELALAGGTAAIAVVAREDFLAAKGLGLHRRTLIWRLPGAGVELAEFAAARPPSTDSLYAVFCGELNQNKDPLTAVAAVAAARHLGADIDLVIAGAGPLDGMLRGLGLPWLTIRPAVPADEMPSLMVGASVVLAPSRREGLPRVVLEALAAGTPVVATANRGTRELLPLVGLSPLRARDPMVWGQAIKQHLRTGRLSREQRAHLEPYSVESFRRSYGLLLDRILTEPRKHGAVDLGEQG